MAIGAEWIGMILAMNEQQEKSIFMDDAKYSSMNRRCIKYVKSLADEMYFQISELIEGNVSIYWNSEFSKSG